MKRSLGVQASVFPMPVLMVSTYDAQGVVNVMNMAWGNMYDDTQVLLNLEPSHKTTANIKLRGAFTLSIADASHVAESDYLGIVSGNRVPDKFARTGLTAVKSENVDAPVVQEYPVTMECKVVEIIENPTCTHVVGQIVNVLADESVIGDNGKVDPTKLNALIFDTFQHGYYVPGEKVGQAWKSGGVFLKDQE
ncbi:MAG: flavin reductase family protein [Planctomycetia bacterium]|nr:flavin reductase family protein [Planctomycetia bacterium]